MKYSKQIILKESKGRAKLFLKIAVSENSSWLDMELFLSSSEIPCFDQRLLFKDFKKVLDLFDRESDSYMMKTNTISCDSDLYLYAGIDGNENQFLGFRPFNEILYFLFKNPFLDFLKDPSKENLLRIDERDDEYFNTKDSFVTNTQRAQKALEKVVEEIANYPSYKLFDFENKHNFFHQGFEFQLRDLYKVKYESLDEFDKQNISYLINKFFESTL